MSNLPVELLEKRTRCEVWTRVMGYHRPVSQFNTGKKAEHCSRKPFTESVSANHRFVKRYGVQVEHAGAAA
jgi:hypothetical protein